MAITFFHLQLLLLISGNLFLRTNGAPVDDICSQTTQPSYCLQCFATDPRSATADLPQLAQIAVDQAAYYGGNTKIDITNREIAEKDPTLKSMYDQCSNYYLDMLYKLQAAKSSLKQQAYGDLKQEGVDARASVDKCEAVFNNNSPFLTTSNFVRILADALALIGQALI